MKFDREYWEGMTRGALYEQISKLEDKVEELTGLLKEASCPNRGCIGGYYFASPSEPEPCQWCYETKAALKQEGEK